AAGRLRNITIDFLMNWRRYRRVTANFFNMVRALIKQLGCYFIFGECFCSFLCRVRRCILSALALAEMLPLWALSTRWICSHSRCFTDAGLSFTGMLGLPCLGACRALRMSCMPTGL